ncbi:hypothetical protein AWENTII_005149 [Aspergillus wentii]
MFLRLCAKLNFTKSDRRDGEKHDEQPPRPNTQVQNRVMKKADVDVSSTQDTKASKHPRENLWEIAGERLDDKYRKFLDLDSPLPITKAIEDVIESTEKKYREYKEGGLKIRKRHGGHINVRDSAKNIIRYALQAQDLVKTIVSFDPTGHASSAWSIVSIGLTMINNAIERRDDIFEASEYLASTLFYYAIVDSHYLDRKVESDQGLEDSLVEVYTAVLQYTAEVKKAEKESAAARVGKSIAALVQQPLKDLKAAIETKGEAVQKWTDLTATLDHRQQAESTLDRIDEAVERLKIIQSHQRSLQDREILDWLSTTSYSDPQNNTQDRRASDTGNWLLELAEYKEWKTTAGQILWLHGAVGCGKSVLCSTVIKDVEEFCYADPSRNFAYWYFQFSNEETQKVYNMIRSILRQFMPRTLPASMIKLWEGHSNRGSKPQQQKLVDILDIIIENFQGEFFLVFDALDECPATGHAERSFLLESLQGLMAKHPSKMHILATSRPEPDIRSKLEKYQNVNLEIGLVEDVETFVRAQVSHGRLCEWGASIQKQILEKLLDIPERRFRWADLQIKRLEESRTEAEIHNALGSIPQTLEDTYKDTLERLSSYHREAARTILIWLSFSAVPLDLKTVAAVVSFRFPEDVVTTCTTSLVTVSTSDDTVRLAHFSVKEFVDRKDTEGQWYQFSAISGHDAMANKTLDCLLDTTEILTKTTAMQQPLLIYAATYWDWHLEELGDLYAKRTGLQEKVDRLFTERDIYFNWVRLLHYYSDYSWGQTFEELDPPLYYASDKGLKTTVETLLAKGAYPSKLRSDGSKNPISAAAEQGHLEVLKLLLEKVDEIPRRVTEGILESTNTPEADKEKLAVILDMLWDKGALHDQSRASRKIIDERLVGTAAGSRRKSGPLLMSLLLDRKEKMTVKITEKVLRAASLNLICGTEIMKLVLNRCDGDIKITSSFMQELISSSSSSPDFMTVVLNRRIDEIMLDEKYVESFARGKKEAMELLLQKRGEEIQVTEKVLIAAARNTHDAQTVRLLLIRREPGTNINKEILISAARNRRKGSEIMNMLLDEFGQDTAIDDEIIQAIAENPDEGLDMMKTLLCRQQAWVGVSEQILDKAATWNNREMLELLVNNARGSDIAITEKIVCSAAQNNDHAVELMEYLFDLRGHSLPITEDVLVSAATAQYYQSRSDDLLTLILERRPEMPVTDRLLEAVSPFPNAIKLLLDRRQDRLPIGKMIKNISTGYNKQPRVQELLLDRQLVQVDEWLVETVAGNSLAMKVIYIRKPEFPVTPKAVLNAAVDPNSLHTLLIRQKNQILITEQVIKASLQDTMPECAIDLLLTRLGPAAVPITEDILIYAIRNGRIMALELLLEQRRDLNLEAVWEAIWQVTELNPYYLTEATGVLFRYAHFDISEMMLEKIPSVSMDEGFWVYPFDGLIRSCLQHRIPLPTTETAFELIVERASVNTIDIFLEDHPDMETTEKHIQAVGRNPRENVDKDDLVSLLLSKKPNVF